MKSPRLRQPAPLPLQLPLPLGTVCVGTEGNIGIWNPLLGGWGDFGTAGGSKVRSLARSPLGQVFAVTTDGSVRTLNLNGWSDPARMGNWTLDMLAWRYDTILMCVSAAGKIGMFGSNRWYEQNLGGWTLKMLTWTPGLQLLGVGTNGNVGIWNGAGWNDLGLMGGWTLKMVAFDKSGRQWCVGTDSNVGLWNGAGWTDLGRPGGWTLDWLFFT